MTTPAYPWTKDEVQSIKACAATDAGRHALSIIVQKLCGITSSSFSSDIAAMAFAEGRRWVGIEINAAVSAPIEKIVKETHEPRSNRPVTATERVERTDAEQSAAALARTVKRR